MMLKNILRLTIPAMAVAGVSQSALAAVTTQPYFNVQEIGVADDVVTPSVHRLRGMAMVDDGTNNYIAAKTQGFRDPFADFDFNLPFTFQYGCQYADEICEAAWRGYQTHGRDDEDGFYNYRDAFTAAFGQSSYTSRIVALLSSDLSSGGTTSTQYPNVATFPIDTLHKFYVKVKDVSTDDHDTRITDMAVISGDVWVTGYDIDVTAGTPPRGFVESLDGTTHIDLEPYAPAPPTALTDGGLSAGYSFGQTADRTWFVAGTTAIEEAEDSNDSDGSYHLCYDREQDVDESDDFQSGEYYRYCPGFRTQAAVWPLGSGSFTDSSVTPIIPATTDANWLDGDNHVNHNAAAFGMNDSGLIPGYVTYRDGSGDIDAYARATLYQFVPAADKGTSAVAAHLDRYVLSGTDLVGDDDDNDIRDQWAVDITNPIDGETYVVGNERYTRHEAASGSNHNQTVNFFVSQLDATPKDTTTWHGNVTWPLRDVVRGASNQIAAIDHTNGLAVGWRETSNSTSAYNGIRREQHAFLFNVPGFESTQSTSGNLWSLQSLTCYTDTTDGSVSVHMPLYRIEHASAVEGDSDNLTVLASGYKYNSVSNYIDRTNATPVILKLTHSSSNADINSLSGCPVYEADTKHSRSGGSAGWLALLLLPGLFVRIITKRKQTLSAS